MDGLTKLANEIGHARDYGQMASAAARKLLDIVSELKAQRMAAMEEQANDIWQIVAEHYVELPRDADGEIIRVGDMMERGEARGRVIALMLSNYPKKWGGGLHWGVQLEGEQAPTALDGFFHHYKPPTTEDMLRKFMYAILNQKPEFREENIAKYAAKLQLKEDE